MSDPRFPPSFRQYVIDSSFGNIETSQATQPIAPSRGSMSNTGTDNMDGNNRAYLHQTSQNRRAALGFSFQPGFLLNPPRSLPIYEGRTRKVGEGFDEDAMYAKFSNFPEAVNLGMEMRAKGFRYVGYTGTSSKAHTLHKVKQIKINKGLTSDEAALSLAYELTNASQVEEALEIHALRKQPKTVKLADMYARRMLWVESQSVLMRSNMAIVIGKEKLVKNARYIKIAKDDSLSETAKRESIFAEMMANGTVHQGRKKAYDYYVNQYWTLN